MKKTMLLLSALVAAATTGNVFAEVVDGSAVSIKVTGRVVASPCQMVNGGKAEKLVELGDIQASSLAKTGDSAGSSNFTIEFSGCPAGTDNITAEFSGNYDTTNSGWKNDAATPATNTAVRLFRQTAATEITATDNKMQVAVTNNTASFALRAEAYSKLGTALPGNIQSTILASFTYQ